MRWLELTQAIGQDAARDRPMFVDLEQVHAMVRVYSDTTRLFFGDDVNTMDVRQTPEQILSNVGWREIDAETR